MIRAPIREHVPPDPGAAMSWLKNRQPGEWRERVEHKHTHGTWTDAEIEERYEELQRQAALDGQANLAPPRKETT